MDSLNVGGTELNAVRTAERLDRDRFDVAVVALRREGPLLERYVAAGIPVHDYAVPSLFGVRAAQQGIRLARWLRSERIDIVHAHDVYSNVFAVPWARVAGVSGTIASRRWWYTVPRPALNTANRLAYSFAHRVLANSASVARLVTEAEGVPPKRVVTIPNFVDDDAFSDLDAGLAASLREAWGVSSQSRTLGIVARLDPVKRHEDLLVAWQKALAAAGHPLWRLVIVGDGPSRSALESLVRSLGIGSTVHFAGMIAPTPGLPSLFDAVALTSSAEGFPNAIVEAMAAGRPVVATNVGGVVDCVENEVTGLLVAPQAPEALAGAIGRVLADRGAAARMGAAGRLRARERFHARVVLEQLETIYQSLVFSQK